MPNVADTLAYRHFRTTNFPFVTATAPTSTSPNYVAGSNLMTSYKGYTERRPGFDVGLEPTPTTFADPVQRTFCWRRWGGNFYIMLCTVGTVAKVWKLAISVDASFSLIWTSTSAEPFDFVVSNNFCFFGNGLDMKKFDGTTVTNWGISVGNISSPTGPTIAGNGADAGGSHPWTNPNNVTSAVTFATVSLTGALPYGQGSDYLNATQFAFAIPATSVITGISVSFTAKVSSGVTNPNIQAFLLKGGIQVGGNISYGPLTTSPVSYTLGGPSELWNTTWSPNDVNQTTFGVALLANVKSGTTTFSLDNVQITIYAIGGPPVSVSGGAGTFSAANGGYQYVFCYTNATTGHVSSPTPPSASTGNFTNKLNVSITLTASADPQVTNIRLFRTTDGGGGIFFEVANSPYPNASGAVTDNTADASLSLITAPTFGFNDPPHPQKGFVWFANRIWGFNNASVYFTDWEEMNIGVPEEGSVSGPAGNFWNFDSEITGLSVAQDGVLIFTAGSIFKIDGDSLDTFRRTVIAKGLGCRNRATITRLGGLTAFLANTNSIWTTDSTSLTEISQMIQPTLDNIDHSQAAMTFHLQGQYRWLLLADQGHSQSLAFDVNMQQWMPPWTIIGQGLHSGETSPGNWTLLLGQKTSNKMLQMIPGQYTDNGSGYTMSGTMNLIPIVPEHLSTGSPIIDLFYPQQPGHIAYMEYVGFDFNAVLPIDVLYELDDDPATATYTSIIANIADAPLRTQGVNVVNKWYYGRKPTGRRVSIKFNYETAGNFKIYTMSIAYRVYR